MTLRVTLRIRRARPGEATRVDEYRVAVPDAASVLDAVERVWGEQDRSLVFRHACHHASCGSCGLRVNGRERLPCVTPVAEYGDGAVLELEPLRHFAVQADLAVDPAPLYERMAAAGAPLTRAAEPVSAGAPAARPDGEPFNRFENCIECGLCLSACPAQAADAGYLGPAALAGAERAWRAADAEGRRSLLALLDGEHGLWRCHEAWECTAVCPAGVFPAEAIMRMRKEVVRWKLGEGLRRLRR